MTSTHPTTSRGWHSPTAAPMGMPPASPGPASAGVAAAGVVSGPRLHAPPAPGRVVAAQGFDLVAASIRNQVIDRLVRMSVRHAMFAWERRRTRPVAPHAVAFLYADPQPAGDEQRPFYQVLAATRMVNDDPGVRELPWLLYRLAALARERYLPAAGGFDPAVHMSNHHDDSASGHASYIGLGVSTLDTPAGTWEETQQHVADPADVPGRCFVLLADHTAILLDRAGRAGFNETSIRATADLSAAPGIAARPWVHHPDTASMPAAADVWQRLFDLHTLTINQPHRPTL